MPHSSCTRMLGYDSLRLMMSAKFFQEFTKQFSESLPPHFETLREEFEYQLCRGLELAFAKLNLVTREEFDTQRKVLAHTQEKVEQLELRLTILESTLEHGNQ